MFTRNFGEHITEIGRHGEIAALIQLIVLEALPFAVNFSALH